MEGKFFREVESGKLKAGKQGEDYPQTQ